MYYKRYLPVLTFVYGVLFINYFRLHPFAGIALAFLFGWLIYEDYKTQLIDIRIALSFALIAVICNANGFLTGLSFFFFMLVILYGTVKYVPTATLSREEIEDKCLLQKGTAFGFIPLLGISSFIFLVLYLLFDIENHIYKTIEAGNVVMTHLWIGYQNMVYISSLIEENSVYYYGIPIILALIAVALKYQIHMNEKRGLIATYAMGDGDPIVIGSLATLFGGIIFFYGILMGSLILGELLRLVINFYNDNLKNDKEGACL